MSFVRVARPAFDDARPLLNQNGLKNRIAILGCRGIPARHGGFETFAEALALHLVKQGWDVTVYCQSTTRSDVDVWRGIRRIFVRVAGDGPLAAMIFDAKATLISLKRRDLPLVLGYNTAVLSILYRLFGLKSLMNMDGIEWRRDRWHFGARQWLRLNEWCGLRFSNFLIADHPAIARHHAWAEKHKKIVTIPYGADAVDAATPAPVREHKLEPGRYALLVARFVPENSLLEVVEAWTKANIPLTLAIVGKADDADPYGKAVKAAAGPNVRFLGAEYDREKLKALRYFARFHIHGHKVGGSNPSLIEALAAGSPVIAHDNCYNRWVTGPSARFFADEPDLAREAKALALASDQELAALRRASRQRFDEAFRWPHVLAQYETLLSQWVS